MSFESAFIGAPDWVLPAALIATGLIGAVAWNYFRAGLRGWRAVAAALKVAGIATLVFCLIEPLGRDQRPVPQANLLPIVVDTSRSMTLRNSAADTSLADRATAALDADTRWVRDLERTFDVRRYSFDTRVRSSESFAELAFEGSASNLRTALQTLGDRFRRRPVAGVLLATDGNWTDPEPAVDWSQLGFPVFPIRDPQSERLRDLRIAEVSVSQTDFETAPVTIDVSIEKTDLPDLPVVVRLVDDAGKLVEEQTLTGVNEAGERSAERRGEREPPVRFRFRPDAAGVSFYRVECFMEGERERFNADESRFEATLENNRRWIAVHRRRGPYSLLYVAGRPNWEFKFLRRAIDQDAEVRLVGLLRIARKQPKFSFRDSALGSTNPLFAGLGGDEEEAAEQLDEPVILRLGVEDEHELVGGFPTDAESLFSFSAVILDDLEAEFFTQDQLQLLRRFVSNRGGSLLMLGGQESLERGGYAETPLGDLAPVYLPGDGQASADRSAPSGPYRMELTREGLLQPFLRLRSTEAAEAARLSLLPPLSVLNTVERIKPGAVVLAVARDAVGDPRPALVSQPFGDGKTAALLLGDLWRWSLRTPPASLASIPAPSPAAGLFGGPAMFESVSSGGVDPADAATAGNVDAEAADDPAQTWRQIVRWLVNDVPGRVEALVAPSSTPGTVEIAVDVRDRAFAPLDGATVSLRIVTPDQMEVDLVATPSPDEAGRYTTPFWPRTAGGYRIHATATAPDGTTVGTAETGWAHDLAGDEFDRLGTNVNLLERIARESGGRIVPVDELDQFADSLNDARLPVSETLVFPLWHRSWVMILAILCLCGEWGIRRWKGMR